MPFKYPLREIISKGKIYIFGSVIGLSRDQNNLIWRHSYRQRLMDLTSSVKADESLPQIRNANQRYVFTSWLQGYEQSPEIVRKCRKSIDKYLGKDFIVVNVTPNNIEKYVSLPEYIVRKWKLNQISNAHFSDILRVALLAEYGGIWIDATVMLFAPIPDEILKADLFLFQGSFIDQLDPAISSWFLATSGSNNVILTEVRDALFEYWKNATRLPDYYLFHDLMVNILNRKDNLQRWQAIPYFNNSEPHLLQKNLYNAYSPSKLQDIVKRAPIQKLTYKLRDDWNKNDGSFLASIMTRDE